MPYRKKRKPRSPYFKTAGNALSVATKALSTAVAIKRLINVEKKFIDTQIASTAVPVGGLITQLTNIAQGDTNITRDGDQLKVVEIHVSLWYVFNVSATATAIRTLLIEDKQTNGAIFTAGNVLEDVTVFDNIVSARNADNMYRFNVLLDRVVNLAAGSGPTKSYKRVFRMQKKLRYDGNAGDITDLASCSYALLFLATEATNTPTVTGFIRLKFIDN